MSGDDGTGQVAFVTMVFADFALRSDAATVVASWCFHKNNFLKTDRANKRALSLAAETIFGENRIYQKILEWFQGFFYLFIEHGNKVIDESE